jgi:tRNA nucleotidyltransferase/poly(A) polymerase
MEMEYKLAKEKADEIVSVLKEDGIECDIVGGVYKQKDNPHDIDIIINADSVINVRALPSYNFDSVPCKIEFYIVGKGHYGRLRHVLRSHRIDIIRGRLMKGLKFKKMVIDNLNPF